MRKLNPFSATLKKHAKKQTTLRTAARLVLQKKRSGQKVNEAELKKARATLGGTILTAKQFKDQLKKKVAARVATKAKVDEANKKKAEKAKANAANPRKSTKKSAPKKK